MALTLRLTALPPLLLVLAVLLMSLTATAAAHVERPSYWPDPAADTLRRMATSKDRRSW